MRDASEEEDGVEKSHAWQVDAGGRGEKCPSAHDQEGKGVAYDADDENGDGKKHGQLDVPLKGG